MKQIYVLLGLFLLDLAIFLAAGIWMSGFESKIPLVVMCLVMSAYLYFAMPRVAVLVRVAG